MIVPTAQEKWFEWLARVAFTALLTCLMPVIALYLLKRSRLQPEYRQGWAERFLAQTPVSVDSSFDPKKHVMRIWVHAVSVGETHAVLPLVKRLNAEYADRGGVSWIFSSTTPTGRATAQLVFGDIGSKQFVYMPYDFPWLWTRFFKRLQPALGLLVETELWPNLLAVAHAKKIPMVMINARVSPGTARGLERFKWLSRPGLSRLTGVIAQTQADASTLKSLGAHNEVVAGNMKFDVTPSKQLLGLGQQWRNNVLTQTNKTRVLLAASTREGEELLILDAWKQLCEQSSGMTNNTLLLIVPRHPQRFEEVKAMIQQMGFSEVQRSAQWLLTGHSMNKNYVLIGDSMGEMPAYYAMADAALMGGSWLEFGGQNLIEACACGCPVALGPHTYNFEKAANDAIDAGAALRFENIGLALDGLDSMLASADDLQRYQHAALIFAGMHQGAAQRTVGALQRLGVLKGFSSAA